MIVGPAMVVTRESSKSSTVASSTTTRPTVRSGCPAEVGAAVANRGWVSHGAAPARS